MALFQTTQSSMIGGAPEYKPVLDSHVDPANETVEGRVGNILKTDSQGTYTNPVVRQAVDRQEQAFNARGLLNSSMALQAGQEAAISKATDIAAPDAKTYYDNRRSNVDASNQFARDQTQFGYDMTKQQDTQAFTSRQDYQKAVQSISSNYQRMIDTINASDMTPEDKSTAIQQAASVRDGEMAFQNNLYSRMPSWQNEWLAAAVPTSGMDINSVTNRDTLSNIANDPGQTQAMRDAALARLQALPASGGAAGAPGAVAPASNGQALPRTVQTAFGQSINVNWDAGTPSLRSQYEQYAQQMGGAALPPAEWYRIAGPGSWNAGGYGGGGGDGTAAGSPGTGGAGVGGTSGDSGGISI